MTRYISFAVVAGLGLLTLLVLMYLMWPGPTHVTYQRYKLVAEQQERTITYSIPNNGGTEVKTQRIPYTSLKPVTETATVAVDRTSQWAKAAVFTILVGLLAVYGVAIFGLWFRDKWERRIEPDIDDNQRNFERVLTVLVSFAVTFFASQNLSQDSSQLSTQLELQSLKDAMSQMSGTLTADTGRPIPPDDVYGPIPQ